MKKELGKCVVCDKPATVFIPPIGLLCDRHDRMTDPTNLKRRPQRGSKKKTKK